MRTSKSTRRCSVLRLLELLIRLRKTCRVARVKETISFNNTQQLKSSDRVRQELRVATKDTLLMMARAKPTIRSPLKVSLNLPLKMC